MCKDLLQAFIFPAVQLACCLNVSFHTDCLPSVLCDMASPHFLCLFLETGLNFPESTKDRPVTACEVLKGISIVCQEILHLLKTRAASGTVHFRPSTMPRNSQPPWSQHQASRNPPLSPGVSSKRALVNKVQVLESKSRIPLRLTCGTY